MRKGDGSGGTDGRRVVFPRSVKSGLLRVQGGRCAYCGRTLRRGRLEIDHRTPLSRGGGNGLDNLQLLCRPCNMRKGIQSDGEFRRRYRQVLPAGGGIPSPPVSQSRFAAETRRTRAPAAVRSIYRERFRAARERRAAHRAGRGGGCGLLAAAAALSLATLALFGRGC